MSFFDGLEKGVTVGVILSNGRMVTGEFRRCIKEFGSIIVKCGSTYRHIDVFKIDLVWQVILKK